MGNSKPEGGTKTPSLLRKLATPLICVAIGGGGVAAAAANGLLIGPSADAKDAGPVLIRKGDDDPFAVASGKSDKGSPVVHGGGGREYRTAYFMFENEFVSNLKASDALIQVAIAASTQRDGRVLMWLGEHETAIRSAILIELANTPITALSSAKGKEELRVRLTSAINEILSEMEGFGGVDQVHFQSLIVQ